MHKDLELSKKELMKNYILTIQSSMALIGFILINLFIICGADLAVKNEFNVAAKKKILVLSSKGGGGHTCAANAIANYLKKDYEICVVNVFCDILGKCDPIKKISFGHSDAEDSYNFLLKYRCNFLLNLYNYFGLFVVKQFKSELVNILYSYIKDGSFDILISITPYINGIGLEAAKKLNIPFIIIPTDLNSENFAYDLEDTNYKKFNYVLPFHDTLLIEKIKNAKIPEDKLRFIGYPLKEDFFESKDINKIKKEWKIPLNKPVAMILMGAIGSTATYMYAFRLSKYKKPLHLIVCLGKSEWLKDKIKRIRFPDHITLTYVGFTNKISDLMAISDVIFTKTGTHSVCEAIQSKVPLILDSINPSLEWENLNPAYINKHSFGRNLTDYQDIYDCLDNILKDKKYKNSLLSQDVYKFSEGLKNLISSLLNI